MQGGQGMSLAGRRLSPLGIPTLVPSACGIPELVQGLGPLGKAGSPRAFGGGLCVRLEGIGDGGAGNNAAHIPPPSGRR